MGKKSIDFIDECEWIETGNKKIDSNTKTRAEEKHGANASDTTRQGNDDGQEKGYARKSPAADSDKSKGKQMLSNGRQRQQVWKTRRK